ncbi:unnamed protein product [Bursaphelenchus xylophilus]|uniref:(pine wood nematode) hypothetical protein n=1 Tax=Bursaphelenchus xylophilus TaxID=6326 RepID=A0A1I7RKD8_BURXY|nr:unnamed protein product [Bursaphelenchus xylophilus]CAG9131369.1 unnamed protein product [Bursaphelenchus xylophilus]
MSCRAEDKTQIYTLDWENDPFHYLDSRYSLARLACLTLDALKEVGYEVIDESSSEKLDISEIPLFTIPHQISQESGILTSDELELSVFNCSPEKGSDNSNPLQSTPKTALPSSVQQLFDSAIEDDSEMFANSYQSYNRSHAFHGSSISLFRDSRTLEMVDRFVEEMLVLDAETLLRKFEGLERDDLVALLVSKKAFKYLQDHLEHSDTLTHGLADLLIANQLINKLSMDSNANYIIQILITSCPSKHAQIMDEFMKQPRELSNGKCSSRVLQEAIQHMEPQLIKKFLTSMHGQEFKIATDQCGNHVIQKVFDTHDYAVFDRFTKRLAEPAILDVIVKSKYGCRVVQKCLETLANAITEDTVPDAINDLVMPLLQKAREYSKNEYANYVIQNLMKHHALERQRDYIIDVVIIGNILQLSQDKFASHVVETALETASSTYMQRLCTEIFEDYNTNPKGQTALEVMMLDQFGNYVAQKLLEYVIKVSQGKVAGKSSWMTEFAETVIKLRPRLENYSSGKKILERIGHFKPDYMRKLQGSDHYNVPHYRVISDYSR